MQQPETQQPISSDDRSKYGSRLKALMYRASHQDDEKIRHGRNASNQITYDDATLLHQRIAIASLQNENEILQQNLEAALEENGQLRKLVEEQQRQRQQNEMATSRNMALQHMVEGTQAHQAESRVTTARNVMTMKPTRRTSTHSFEAILASQGRLPMRSDAAVQRHLSTNAQEQLRVRLEIQRLQKELQALSRKLGPP